MHKSESVSENATYKILRDFEIQRNQLIKAKRPDQLLFKKSRICRPVDLAVSADHRVEMKENEKIN